MCSVRGMVHENGLDRTQQDGLCRCVFACNNNNTALFIWASCLLLCSSGPCRQCVLPGPGCPGDQVSHRQPKTMETLWHQAIHGNGRTHVCMHKNMFVQCAREDSHSVAHRVTFHLKEILSQLHYDHLAFHIMRISEAIPFSCIYNKLLFFLNWVWIIQFCLLCLPAANLWQLQHHHSPHTREILLPVQLWLHSSSR